MKRYALSVFILILGGFDVVAQVVINEIFPQTNKVEIKNLGAGSVNIANWNLCTFPSYRSLSTLTFDCGTTNLGPDEIATVTVTWSLSSSNDELGLYINNSDFGSSANIRDYVEWGSSGHARSSVAVGASIWSNNSFVPSFGASSSLEYDGSGNSPGDWMEQVNNTLCSENGGNPICMLTNAGLSNILCDDNGTPSDPSDDKIIFSLNPEGTNLSTTYTVQTSLGTVMPSSAAYGAIQVFELPSGSAGAGNVPISIIDASDATCTFDVEVVAGSCSQLCNLIATGLTAIDCNDNGTSPDTLDDKILFSLNPGGTNLSTTYTVQTSLGTVMPSSATYGALQAFEMQTGSAGAGNVTVIIMDMDDPNCIISDSLIDPGTCSIISSLINLRIDQALHIFPNPANNELSIRLDNLGIDKIQGAQLINTSGQIIRDNRNQEESKTDIDLSPITAGLYYLRVLISNQWYSRKLIVNH